LYQENHHVLVLQVFSMARLVRATGITVKLIDLQNTQFGAKICDLSYIWADLL